MMKSDFHSDTSNGLVYIDQAIIVLNKPAGMLSVAGRGPDKQNSLAQQVQQIYPDACVVHRLDMATSGLIIMGRGKTNQSLLSKLFQTRQVKKTYLAWVAGSPLQNQGSIDLPIMPDWPLRPRQKVDMLQGKPSLTHYKVLKRVPEQQKTLLSVEPYTGRSHQIRVHLNAIGHPVLGDTLYAPVQYASPYPRLLLHAWRLEFRHPLTQEPLFFQLTPDFDMN